MYFDIMYHEHLLYYRIETLSYLLNMYDLEIFDVYEADVHGGSIIVFISHKNSREINRNVLQYIEYEKENNFNDFNTYQNFALEVPFRQFPM